jgi:dTMP kinase
MNDAIRPGNAIFSRTLPEMPGPPLAGRLFAVEGADGSGRSTQITHLSRWLESKGFAVQIAGIKRSNLVSDELDRAKHGNVLNARTMSLFYATDFFDQLINRIIPALVAGQIVLADRYIYTLMARDLVRGANPEWLENLYSPAITPDAVFYLKASAETLVSRNFQKNATLDYWESGMDLGLSTDMFDSFIKYQNLTQGVFETMAATYAFDIIDADRPVFALQKALRKKIKTLLEF